VLLSETFFIPLKRGGVRVPRTVLNQRNSPLRSVSAFPQPPLTFYWPRWRSASVPTRRGWIR